MKFIGVRWFDGKAWFPELPSSWFSELFTAAQPIPGTTVFRRTLSADVNRAGTRIHDA